MLYKVGGSDLAQAATTSAALSFNMVFGNGAISLFTQLFPVPGQITMFNANTTALDPDQPGMPITSKYQQTMVPSGNPYYSRIVDGKAIFTKKPWTMYMVGQSNAHSNFPAFNGTPAIITNNGNTHLFPAQAQIQGALHALVPAIGIQKNGQNPNVNPVPAGAPQFSNVPDANATIGLFSSAASQLMNRLGNAANQNLYSQYYTALLGLTRWSGRPTYQTSTQDAQTALGLVVKNLGTQLAVQPGQEATFAGAVVNMDNNLKALTQMFIVAGNAFKLGLTAQVTTGGYFNDPHGHFAAPTGTIDDGLARSLAAFQDYMNAIPDPNSPGKSLGDRLVMTAHGDTLKNPHQRSGWPDGTPQGSNVLFVQGAGYLPGGWFGDITPTNRVNFDPVTGKANPAAPTAQCTSVANGAVLYATALGNKDIARTYYSADLGNLVNATLLT